jgi:hypothetical protein
MLVIIGLVTDPAQQAAARGALRAAAVELNVGEHELTVRDVVRRRREGSKAPFYYVTVQGPAGDQLRFQVSDNGARVELDWPRR